MITLHHLNNSRSQRILWMLEELELDYEIVPYQRDPVTQLAPESLKKIHPLGKSPVITEGNRTIAESAVIIEYLIDTHGPQLKPEKSSDYYWSYRYWMHYAEGSLMPFLVMKLVFDKMKNESPFLVKPITGAIHAQVMKMFLGPNLDTHLDFIENHLSQHAFFAGESLTGADIQMSFPLEAGMTRVEKSYPSIQAYLKSIHQREAYQRALKAGGPYDYA